MQEAVGGLIDIVDLNDDACILLNDEGKLTGLEGNRRINGDVIAGKFYVCSSTENGELASLSDEVLEKYREMFWEPEEITQEEIEATCRIEFYPLDSKAKTVFPKT